MSIRLQISINAEYVNVPAELMVEPIRIAICSCFGIDIENVTICDSHEFLYQISLGDLTADQLFSRIQREVCDSNSVLNSLPRTRRVFSRAKFSIYGDSSSAVPLIEFSAPENHEFEEEEPLPMTTKLSLPPNSTHNPVRVVFIDGMSQGDLEKEQLDRSVLIQVPAEIVDEDQPAFTSPGKMTIGRIDELLARPVPTFPNSFSELKNLFVNYPESCNLPYCIVSVPYYLIDIYLGGSLWCGETVSTSIEGHEIPRAACYR